MCIFSFIYTKLFFFYMLSHIGTSTWHYFLLTICKKYFCIPAYYVYMHLCPYEQSNKTALGTYMRPRSVSLVMPAPAIMPLRPAITPIMGLLPLYRAAIIFNRITEEVYCWNQSFLQFWELQKEQDCVLQHCSCH